MTGLRVAVIGQGFMGKAHSFAWSRAGQLANDPLRVELAVLCGRDRQALERNQQLWGFERISGDWRAVVEDDDVDLVDVCTPGASHAEIALAALRAGKHVLCEKPLANSVDEARILVEAAKRAATGGRFAMVGFNYRRVPALALARQLVAEGRIGEIRHVRARYLQDWLVDPAFPRTWRLVREEAGSGALGDLGAHVVDQVRFLTGHDLVEVAAFTDTFIKERPLPGQNGRGDVTVDDAAIAVGRTANGALVTLEATRVAPGRKNALTIELNGSEGSIAFDLERLNELTIEERSREEGFRKLLVTSPKDPYLAQWWPPGHILGWEHSFVHECEDLLAAIAADRQPEPSFEDGLAVQLVLEAIERSAQERRFVEVEETR